MMTNRISVDAPALGQVMIEVNVEQHCDGFVAYPFGLKGVVVGQGDTYEEALADVTSAIRVHIETFGDEVLEPEEERP